MRYLLNYLKFVDFDLKLELRKVTILYHHTSFERAESILWNQAISGCHWENMESHEASPHFHMEEEREAFNGLPPGVNPEITLYFTSDLLKEPCPSNKPAPNAINIHHDLLGNFWQATIRPGHEIILAQAKFNAVGGSKFLYCLVRKRLGSKIRTTWHWRTNKHGILEHEICHHTYPSRIEKSLFIIKS
ncbi:hypothetical protein [Gluconobacter wancherniae]|uniref:hypothetical protein n=1 Tax=Gluconobacter wancherniae TaxID=1307955 RepID=UPI001B8D6CB0|nr:hypothetical protein [Gluconobacter wancherniae]